MKLRHIPRLLIAAFKTKISVELRSSPGLGKSSVVEQTRALLEKLYGEPVGLITELLSTMEGIDLRGIPERVKDLETGITMTGWSAPPIFPSKLKFPGPGGIPRYGIVFLDEFLQGTLDARKPASRLMLEGRLGDFDLNTFGHWVTWAASNNVTDRSGAGKDMAMSANRKMIVQVEPDLDAWLEWAEHNDVHYGTMSFVKADPTHIFAGVPKEDGPFASPRTIVMADRQLREMAPEGEDFLLDAVGLEIAASLLGESVASAFSTHMRKLGELPDWDDIIRDPGGCKVPKGIDNKYLVSQMVAFRVEGATAVPAFEYVLRLPEDLQVMAIRHALKRTPSLVQVPAFAEWVRKHQGLLMKVAAASVTKW